MACTGSANCSVVSEIRRRPGRQSLAKAILASSARSTNGVPLTSTTALTIVPPVNGHGDVPE
jgi:hypothetical protein